jgi:uncharacterized protein (DUF433 family)
LEDGHHGETGYGNRRGEAYEYYPLGNYVVRAPGVCGGRPTFKYTRIDITGTLDRLAAGEHIDKVVAGYRGRVSKEAVVEAIHLISVPSVELASL